MAPTSPFFGLSTDPKRSWGFSNPGPNDPIWPFYTPWFWPITRGRYLLLRPKGHFGRPIIHKNVI